jgi:16S rRNA G1207 methylase RsmC
VSTEHYFSPSPDGATGQRTLHLTLAGHEIEVVTAAGVFSGDRLDLGTRVLLREVPSPPPAGNLLDLGCGWGPLTLAMAMASPLAQVWAVDVNARARELTAENAARLGLGNVRVVAPEEIAEEVRFAAIWSNPPIRIGKPALHALLLQWLPRLDAGAVGHLVVQRNLGADSLHAWLTAILGERDPVMTVRRLGSAKGYRVLEIRR